jgi:transcription elongation factor GreB
VVPAQEEEDEDETLRPKGKRYITHTGAQRLHAELIQLLHKERPKVTAEVSAAAAQGDRSENAEYIYGKRRLREIDRRIRFLQQRLDTCTVVVPADQKDVGRIYFGATVTVEDEEGNRSTYQLVGPDEIDAGGGRISVDSPVGRALIGKRLDEEVSVVRPRGETLWIIVEIRYL